MKDFYTEKKVGGTFYRVPVKTAGKIEKINLGYVSRKEADRLSRLIQKLVRARREDVVLPDEVMDMVNDPLHHKIARQLLDLKLLEEQKEVIIPTLKDAVVEQVTHDLKLNLFNPESADGYTASVSDKPRKIGFLQHAGEHRRIDEFTTEDIQSWIAATDFAEATIGKYLEAYRAGVEHFLKQHPETQFRNVFADHLDKNAYRSTLSEKKKLEQDKFLATTNFVDDIMTGDMCQRTDKLNAEYKLLLQLERWIGMRAAEIRILRWCDIADGVVTIRGKRAGKKGSHVNRSEMRVRQSPLWHGAIEALNYFRERYAQDDDVYLLNAICDLRNKPEFQQYDGLEKVGMRGRWDCDLSKPINTIYSRNGYPEVIQPNHIWKKNRITELKNETDNNGSPKWRESNIAYWMGDTEKMAAKVYQGFTRATQDAVKRSVAAECGQSGSAAGVLSNNGYQTGGAYGVSKSNY